MNYRIAIVPADGRAPAITASTPERLTMEAGVLLRTVDTDNDGYWRTDPTGQFFELAPSRGHIELYPLAAVRQIVIMEDPA